MGLTINYKLRAPHVKTRKEALSIVRTLHAFAKKLPVDRVSKVMQWNREDGPPERAMFHGYLIPRGQKKDYTNYTSVEPLELMMFSVNHKGSETASFGLGRYPEIANDPERAILGKRTGLSGWNWQNFCKTQYASLSSRGGWSNFFAIHDGICQVLWEAQRLGVKVAVNDEGGYWKHRDADRLRKQVEQSNALVAAFTGRFKDMMGDQITAVVSPITEDPQYEHLEAKGQELFKKRRRSKPGESGSKDD